MRQALAREQAQNAESNEMANTKLQQIRDCNAKRPRVCAMVAASMA